MSGRNHLTGNSEACSCFAIFRGRWYARILYEMSLADAYRFLELKRMIPRISNPVLAQSLRDLMEMGLVERMQYDEAQLRVEYSLTERGRALRPVFDEMLRWERMGAQ